MWYREWRSHMKLKVQGLGGCVWQISPRWKGSWAQVATEKEYSLGKKSSWITRDSHCLLWLLWKKVFCSWMEAFQFLQRTSFPSRSFNSCCQFEEFKFQQLLTQSPWRLMIWHEWFRTKPHFWQKIKQKQKQSWKGSNIFPQGWPPYFYIPSQYHSAYTPLFLILNWKANGWWAWILLIRFNMQPID